MSQNIFFVILILSVLCCLQVKAQTTDEFEIFIKSLVVGRTLTIKVYSTSSIMLIKNKIYESQRIPQETQQLYFGGELLEDGKTLEDYRLGKGSKLTLIIVSRGGN